MSSDEEPAPLSLIEVSQGTPVIREKDEVPASSKTNPWSLIPVAEAGKAKVSVSVLLLIAVAYGAYHLGSQRHEDSITQLRSELAELKRTQDGSCKQTRVDELLL